MHTHNSFYFNTYRLTRKLLLLLAGGVLAACGRQNEPIKSIPLETKSHTAISSTNINTADASELEKLPYIGQKTANEIVEHRERFGKFRKSEHLLLVRGISDEKFRELKNLIKTE